MKKFICLALLAWLTCSAAQTLPESNVSFFRVPMNVPIKNMPLCGKSPDTTWCLAEKSIQENGAGGYAGKILVKNNELPSWAKSIKNFFIDAEFGLDNEVLKLEVNKLDCTGSNYFDIISSISEKTGVRARAARLSSDTTAYFWSSAPWEVSLVATPYYFICTLKIESPSYLAARNKDEKKAIRDNASKL